MEYLIPVLAIAAIVVVGIAGFVLASRRRTTAGGHDATPSDRRDSAAPGIGGDRTPLGDTSEHAGTRTA